MTSTFQHASHVHPLELIGPLEMNLRETSCHACNLPFTSVDSLFGCRSCRFFLHCSCGLLSPSLPAHPAHLKHPLRLVYASPYGNGSPWWCDICGEEGRGFIYRCPACKFDAHVPCVNLPQTFQSLAHQHLLQLLFCPPSVGSTFCDVCRNQVQWGCYSCDRCSFFVHLECSNRRPSIGGSTSQRGYIGQPMIGGSNYNYQERRPMTGDVYNQQGPIGQPITGGLNNQQGPIGQPITGGYNNQQGPTRTNAARNIRLGLEAVNTVTRVLDLVDENPFGRIWRLFGGDEDDDDEDDVDE